MGLAPKSATSGPVLIRNLKNQKVISEQSATLHFNPNSSSRASTLTLGAIEDATQMITGDWHNHKLIAEDFGTYSTFTLNVSQITYDEAVLYK